MGRLTDDMTALANDIHTSHEKRTDDLQKMQEVHETLAGFRSAHQTMAKALCQTLKDTIEPLREGEAKRVKAAHEFHKELLGFVSELQDTVDKLQDEACKHMAEIREETAERREEVRVQLGGFAADLAGAHAAWFGSKASSPLGRGDRSRSTKAFSRSK